MPKVSTVVPHSLGREEAERRLREFIPRVREDYGDQIKDLQGDWQDNQLNFSFTTVGLKIGGNLQVNDTDVMFTGDVPFAAMMFKGKIESTVQSELKKLLS